MRRNDRAAWADEVAAAWDGRPARPDAGKLADAMRFLLPGPPDEVTEAAVGLMPPRTRRRLLADVSASLNWAGARGTSSKSLMVRYDELSVRLEYDNRSDGLWVLGRMDEEGWLLDAAGQTHVLKAGEVFEVRLGEHEESGLRFWNADAEFSVPPFVEPEP